jgi:hypothetical protein
MDDGPERVDDPEVRQRSRREAVKVHLWSAGTAVVLTAIVFAL